MKKIACKYDLNDYVKLIQNETRKSYQNFGKYST
jgi:hypothetical protein